MCFRLLNCCSGKKLAEVAWEGVKGAVVHGFSGVVMGPLGSVILRQSGFPADLAAKIGVISGAIFGGVTGGGRGVAGWHFKPHEIESARVAFLELGASLLIVNVGGLITISCTSAESSQIWQSLLSFLISTSIVGGVSLGGYAVSRCSSKITFLRGGASDLQITRVSNRPTSTFRKSRGARLPSFTTGSAPSKAGGSSILNSLKGFKLPSLNF